MFSLEKQTDKSAGLCNLTWKLTFISCRQTSHNWIQMLTNLDSKLEWRTSCELKFASGTL